MSRCLFSYLSYSDANRVFSASHYIVKRDLSVCTTLFHSISQMAEFSENKYYCISNMCFDFLCKFCLIYYVYFWF